jgi:hypothetical protein
MAVRPFSCREAGKTKRKFTAFPSFRLIVFIPATVFHSIFCCVALLYCINFIDQCTSMFFCFCYLAFSSQNVFNRFQHFTYFYKNHLLEEVSTHFTIAPLRLVVLYSMAHDQYHCCSVHCIHPFIHHRTKKLFRH